MNGIPAPEVEYIVKTMEGIVSSKYVSTNTFEKIKNCTVPRAYEVEEDILPYAVVLPQSKEQISEILKFANTQGVPVFVRGSGTSLSAHSRPHTRGILLNLSRMQKLEIFEEYGFFECEPGITAGKVAEELAKIKCFLPVWPGSRIVACMGGLVINNTSGHIISSCLGKPGDYVMGLEIVLPGGDIIETGSKGLRRIAGTDLTKLFVGSDGILGVVTKIRLRLLPQFEEAYGLAEFKDLSDLARGVQRLYQERHPAPLFMEMMDHEVSRIGYRIKELEPPEGSVVMFVETGFSEEEAFAKMSEVLEVFRKEGATKTHSIKDLETWHKIWGAREVIGPYLMQQNSDVVNSAEVVSNLKDMVEFMDDCVNFNRGLPCLGQLKNYLYGHIGDLTLHPTFLIPRQWDKETKRRAVKETFQREAELNLKYDTCGGEWGQLSVRAPFFVKKFGQKGYELIGSLKRMLDPNNILNPGILEGYR